MGILAIIISFVFNNIFQEINECTQMGKTLHANVELHNWWEKTE